jgi:amino acid adenylation domain-containing protein
LLRVGLIRLNEGMHLLLVDMHHIISDGTSQDILVRDFTALYADRVLAPLRLQYKDYSEWQNSETQQAIMKSQEKYWLREFSGELPVLNLPTDYPRPLIQSIAGRQLSFTINKEMVGMIKGLCRKTAATLYMVLLGVITVLLAKLGSQEDIIVGIPTAGRRHTDLQDIIGMFINTLSMRNYPTGDKSFIEFVEEVKERTLEAYENQEYQFEDLVEKVSVRRDTGRNPIFDVVFNFLNQADYRNYRGQAGVNPAQPGLIEIIEDMGESKSNFDILFQGTEIEDMIYFSINYCTALYKGETIRRFIDYFKKLLVEIRENPSRKLSSLEILPEEEKNRLLFDFNDTAAEYPGEKTIHRLFEEQAEKAPQRMAAAGREKKIGEIVQLTYGELNGKSDRLAHGLKKKGVLADSIIGIMMKRSVEMIIGILGILKAGGAYLPIDPEYPRERIEYMLKDSNAKLLVTINNLEELDNLKTSQPHNFILSSTVGSQLPTTSLAYIIYTSGTTGKPKGCMIEHRNLVRLLVNDRFPFNFSLNDTWTLFHSYCFDFSVWEIWGAFVYGGRLIIVPGMIARDPHRFLELLKKEQVTVLNQTPAAFYHLSDEVLSNKEKSFHIRYIIFGGEALAPARLKEWHDNYPQTKLINMYGITETTVHVTFKEITQREIRLNEGNIGKPIPTLNTYIVDRYGKLQPLGVAGELWVGGAGVSRGYLNNPELTAEKFDQDLLDFYDSHNDNQLRPPGRRRLYRTGDLVRRLSNGEMEYLGRIDQQVKIRGFRVELGEIEACLLRNPVIKEAVVMASGQDETKALTAYITVNTKLKVEELREYIDTQLPGYMVPSYFVQLDALPLLPNGKINREALAGLKPLESTREYRPPQNDLESELLSTWKKYIKTERLSTNVNFFEAGGNSLSLVRVHSEIEKKYPGVTLMDLFAKPNIADLALFLSKKKNSAALKIEPLPLDKGYFSTERENGVLEYTLNLESLTKLKEHGNRENLDIQDILRTSFGYLLFEISKQNLIQYYVTLNDEQIIPIYHNYEDIDSIEELLQVSRRQFLNPGQIYPVDDFMKTRANPGSYQVLPLYSNPLNREFENTDLHLQAKTNNGTVEIAFRFSPRMDREEMRQLPGLYAAIVEEIVNETRG